MRRIVGVPKEIKSGEKRVGLTPGGVNRLAQKGVPVFVQKGAGIGSGFADAAYASAGARMVSDLETLYQSADIIQKVKEPQPAEYGFFRPNQILFCFLHLASPTECELVEALVRSQVTALGFETIETGRVMLLLAPMSEIAGALSAIYAAFSRKQSLVKNGKISYPVEFHKLLESLAAAYPSCSPDLAIGRVVIFGGGVAGQKALEFALKMDAVVTVVEKNTARQQALREKWKKESSRLTIIGIEEVTETILEPADVLIGCVHRAGHRADQVITPEMLKAVSLTHKKIIMDISIDQGGNFPEARATTYEDPFYLDSSGNLRFSVANIPSLCGPAASEALTEASFQYTLAMAEDFDKALKSFPELAKAVNIHSGKIIHPAVRKAHQK